MAEWTGVSNSYLSLSLPFSTNHAVFNWPPFPGTGPNIHRHCQIVMGVFQITLEVKLSPLSWP